MRVVARMRWRDYGIYSEYTLICSDEYIGCATRTGEVATDAWCRSRQVATEQSKTQSIPDLASLNWANVVSSIRQSSAYQLYGAQEDLLTLACELLQHLLLCNVESISGNWSLRSGSYQ